MQRRILKKSCFEPLGSLHLSCYVKMKVSLDIERIDNNERKKHLHNLITSSIFKTEYFCTRSDRLTFIYFLFFFELFSFAVFFCLSDRFTRMQFQCTLRNKCSANKGYLVLIVWIPHFMVFLVVRTPSKFRIRVSGTIVQS